MKKKKEVKYLLQGGEPKERVELLLELTSITSKSGKDAIMDHLVVGHIPSKASVINDHEHLSRDLNVLNRAAGIVEKIKELDWAKFKEENRSNKNV